MIEYIYFVKCPNCDDEPFSFFDAAKEFACGCLSQKPIITQVEVNRNDFGECTDSADLGTVWSWEDMMSDTEKEHSDEPSLLTKDFLNSINSENDPEFDALDNSVEVEDEDFRFLNDEELNEALGFTLSNDRESKEILHMCEFLGLKKVTDLEDFLKREFDVTKPLSKSECLELLFDYRLKLGDDYDGPVNDSKFESCSRKPIPEGMTIEQLVEEMEENEDEVECTWCNELFPKDQCRYEVDLGYLCSRCEAAIKSRGETLTFRENNYWDFLDEEKEPVKEYIERDPFDHHDSDYSDEEAADALADEIDRAWDSRYDTAVDDFFNEDFDDPVSEDGKETEESLFDEAESVEEVVDILVKDEEAAIAAYEEAADKIEELTSDEDTEETQEVLDHIKEEEEEHIEELEELLTEESEDQDTDTLDEHVNEEHPAIESNQKLDGIDNAMVDCEVADVIAHSEDEKPVDCKGKKKPLEKPLTEAAAMIDCPECGAKKAFDKETGVCNNCGFII